MTHGRDASPRRGFRAARLLLLVVLFCGLLGAFLSLTLVGLGRGGDALLAAGPGAAAALGAGLALDRAGRGP